MRSLLLTITKEAGLNAASKQQRNILTPLVADDVYKKKQQHSLEPDGYDSNYDSICEVDDPQSTINLW